MRFPNRRAGGAPAVKRKVRQRKRKKAAALLPEAAADDASWRIIHGDSLNEVPRLREGSVRLGFADSPYNIGIDYGGGVKADLLPRPQYLAWCGEWMKAVVRTLTPDGSFWVLINDENAAEFKTLLEAAGLHLRQWIIWYETFGQNNSSMSGFNHTHRHLFWTVKDPERFVFHPEAVNRLSDRQSDKYKDKRANPDGKNWDSVWGINPPIPRLTATSPERLEGFPTQLPLDLLCPIVGVASDPGDLVLDPFCGSATTGVASVKAGRRFIGIEQREEFCRLARRRPEWKALKT